MYIPISFAIWKLHQETELKPRENAAESAAMRPRVDRQTWRSTFVETAYEGDADGDRLLIQFFNSLSPPDFSAIQELVVISTDQSPSHLDLAIYTGGSFFPTTILGGECIALLRNITIAEEESLPLGGHS